MVLSERVPNLAVPGAVGVCIQVYGYCPVDYYKFYAGTVCYAPCFDSVAADGVCDRALRFPREKDLIRVLILLPIVLPGMVVALFLSRAFDYLGLTQSFVGLVLGHTLMGLPYMLRLLSTSFGAIPKEISDAASNLGASELTKFRRIYIPLIMPGIFVGAIFTFITSLEEFSLTFVIGTPSFQTIPTVLFRFLGHSFVRTDASVVALLLMVPTTLLLFVADRYLKTDLLAAGYGKL